MAPTQKPFIAAAFSAAADLYTAPPLRFFDHLGEGSAARAALRPGEMVLDVCCGAGASALPAARAVAPGGRVIGVDLSPEMLALARARAAAQAVANVEFRHADFDQVYFRPESFDAVICVFGLFFFPDMPAALRKMWRFLRPGGRLVVVIWGPDAFEPAHTLYEDALRCGRPDLADVHSPRKRLSEPGALQQVFAEAGISPVEIEAEDRQHTLASAEDWWTIVMGTAHRGRVDQLTPDQRERVRQSCVGLTTLTLRMPVVYAVARR